MPLRRSTHVRMFKKGGSTLVSNGSGSPGRRTRKTRNERSLAIRSVASLYSRSSQLPNPCGPMKTAQVEDARKPTASSSCQSPAGVRHHLSSQGSSPSRFNLAALRSTTGFSRLLCERKTLKLCVGVSTDVGGVGWGIVSLKLHQVAHRLHFRLSRRKALS